MESRLHRKRIIQRILYSKPMIVLLAVIAAACVYWAGAAYQKMALTEDRVHEMRERKERLDEREKILREKLAALDTVRGREAEIRRKYSVTKEGERMVVIMDRPAATSSNKDTDVGIITRMWRAVTGIFN